MLTALGWLAVLGSMGRTLRSRVEDQVKRLRPGRGLLVPSFGDLRRGKLPACTGLWALTPRPSQDCQPTNPAAVGLESCRAPPAALRRLHSRPPDIQVRDLG